MVFNKNYKPATFLFVCLLLCTSCSVKMNDTGPPSVILFEQQDKKASLVINTGSNLNPDKTGRPSPLVLRFYQLVNNAQFNDSDLYKLLDNDLAILGSELKQKDQVTVYPGETQNYLLGVHPDARYLGVIAAFQDISSANPKLVIDFRGKDPKDMCLEINALSLKVLEEC